MVSDLDNIFKKRKELIKKKIFIMLNRWFTIFKIGVQIVMSLSSLGT